MAKNLSGIYIILCKTTGKVYVGSSVNCKRRWKEHKLNLKEGSHHSPKLQNAWNKYGENNFSFNFVEEVIDPFLLESIEQKWMNNKDSYKNGYNSRKEASAGEWVKQNLSKEYIIRFSDGQEIKIKNLTEYCRNNNLNQGAMSAISRYLMNHHKNIHCRFSYDTYKEWLEKRKNIIKSRPPKKRPEAYTNKWIISHPDGKEEVVDSLTDFCLKHGLSQGNMTEVSRGRRKQHKGFKCRAC